MGLVDDIKKEAQRKGAKIQSSEAEELERILNRTFYLQKNIDEEVKFLRQVMTRGLESQERIGLHASAMIETEGKFCYRQQVLSLLYRQLQGEQVNVGLKRIFAEGDAVHEKWQRLFIRAGYGKAKHMDKTCFHSGYELSYTPDILCKIPDFYDKPMVGEIKSVNTFQFKKMTNHPSGRKQMQFYMYLKGYDKGFVLCDDKNDQNFKLFIEDYDEDTVHPFIVRCENVQKYKNRAVHEGKMVKRHKTCTSYTCKRAETCPMKDACYGKSKELIANV